MAEQALVVIDNYKYILTAAPDVQSPLVKSERAEVLKDIKLDELVQGLRRSRGLLDLAFHGVYSSGDLRARVRTLQDRLMVLAGDSQTTMASISANSGSIVGAMAEMFRFLLMGKETTAVKFIKACSTYALAMAERAGSLADRFDALATDANSTLGAVMAEQDVRDQEKARLMAEREQAERRTKAMKEQVRLLAEDKAELNGRYEELKVAAETAENRAFGMALVGAILKPLAAGVGAAAGAYASSMGGKVPPMGRSSTITPGGGGNAPASTSTAPPPPPEVKVSAETEQLLALFDQAEADNDPEASDRDFAATIEEASTDTKQRLLAALTEHLENDRKEAESFSRWQAAAAGVKAAAEKAGDGLEDASNDYAKVAEGYQHQKIETLKMLQEVRRQEREALVSIVDFAERMKSVKDLQTINKSVLDALHQAVGALQSVVVILRQSQLFWTNMKTAFETLSNTTLDVSFEGYMDLDLETKRELYSDPSVVKPLLVYIARWQALKLIADEYGAACAKVRSGVELDYQKLPSTTAEALAAVPELAQQLLADTVPALEATRTEEAEIDTALLTALVA